MLNSRNDEHELVLRGGCGPQSTSHSESGDEQEHYGHVTALSSNYSRVPKSLSVDEYN